MITAKKNDAELDLSNIPPGSTIILSTTSADKKEEYAAIFRKYNVNFFTLEDFGLSPQHTDEMTGEYDDNMKEKAVELSYTLHKYQNEIRQALIDKGVYKEQDFIGDDGPMIVGMVEDSGFEIFPHIQDKPGASVELRISFLEKFQNVLYDRLFNRFTEAGGDPHEREKIYQGLSDLKVAERELTLGDNTDWVLHLNTNDGAPGANLKPVYEHLQGGLIELMDIIYNIYDEVISDLICQEPSLRFKQHSSAMFVSASHDGVSGVVDHNVMKGTNEGVIVGREEFESLHSLLSNPELSDNASDRIRDLTVSSIVLPDGQDGEKSLNRTTLVSRGLFNGNVNADDYRVDLVDQLAEKHNISLVSQNEDIRFVNPVPPKVAFVHAGRGNNRILNILSQRLRETNGFSFIRVPSHEELLDNPNISFASDIEGRGNADVVFLMPSQDPDYRDLDNLRLLDAYIVDSQTRPDAKETVLVVLNPVEDREGWFDPALSIVQFNRATGLRNGIAELKEIVVFNPKDVDDPDKVEQLNDRLVEILSSVADNKKHKLTDVKPVDVNGHHLETALPPVPSDDQFTVFVAGGAHNDNPLYKETANRLGRAIFSMPDAHLVTGAGQKDGPMGAVLSGFIEAWLEDSFAEMTTEVGKKFLFDAIAGNALESHAPEDARGGSRARFENNIITAVANRGNLDRLLTEAPSVVKALLEADREKLLEAAKAESDEKRQELEHLLTNPGAQKILDGIRDRVTGYSMKWMLTLEGSGESMPGTGFYDVGNMQRRMNRMISGSASLFMPGADGTGQELVEAVIQNIDACLMGQEVTDIIVYNAEAYGGARVFDPFLELVHKDLGRIGISEDLIKLHVEEDIVKVEKCLTDSYSRWSEGREPTTSGLRPTP